MTTILIVENLYSRPVLDPLSTQTYILMHTHTHIYYIVMYVFVHPPAQCPLHTRNCHTSSTEKKKPYEMEHMSQQFYIISGHDDNDILCRVGLDYYIYIYSQFIYQLHHYHPSWLQTLHSSLCHVKCMAAVSRRHNRIATLEESNNRNVICL